MNHSRIDIPDFSSLVLYEDNHLLAVCKPAGLLTQGDDTGRPNLLDLAKDYIKNRYNKPGRVFLGLVHRLDRQVAGVVVFARTSKAAGRLSAQFRDHSTEKIYWALVEGRPEPADGVVESCLTRRENITVTAKPDDSGAQKAKLSYHTLEAGDDATLLEVHLLTGRKHQIRAQLSAQGHPILGDRLYGSRWPERAGSIGLLARRLTIAHPITRESMTFEALPPDWPWLPLT